MDLAPGYTVNLISKSSTSYSLFQGCCILVPVPKPPNFSFCHIFTLSFSMPFTFLVTFHILRKALADYTCKMSQGWEFTSITLCHFRCWIPIQNLSEISHSVWHSILLLMCPLQGNKWWFKHMDPYHSCRIQDQVLKF